MSEPLTPEERIERAEREVIRLTGSGPGGQLDKHFRMTVPAEPDRDSDLVLMDGLAAGREALAARAGVPAEPPDADDHDHHFDKRCETCKYLAESARPAEPGDLAAALAEYGRALYSTHRSHGYHVGPEHALCREYVVGECALSRPAPEPLDVERVERAIQAAYDHHDDHRTRHPGHTGACQDDWPSAWRLAPLVLAALAPTEPSHQEPTDAAAVHRASVDAINARIAEETPE